MSPEPFEIAALLLTFTSVAGWLNHRFLRLPSSVGMLAAGVIGAVVLLLISRARPDVALVADMLNFITHFDFATVLMGVLLAYLLFAGAMHTDATELLRHPFSIAALSTLGVLVSSLLIAGGLWLAARMVGAPLPFTWAFVFGALISPTDPVAVLATLKLGAPKGALKGVMQGESLFNDGVGVVVFGAALTVAQGGSAHPLPLIGEVGIEALGGALLGGLAGALVVALMKAIDEYSVETGLTLALATGVYALAARLHVSGPIAVVVAGLVVGTPGVRVAMSDQTRRYITGFWTLVDDNLNALLFFLLGLEVVVVLSFTREVWILCATAIPLAVLARAVAVAPTALRLVQSGELRPRQGVVVVWGGLRGGISVALALSVGASPYRETILACTYAVVVFSILVQGMTFPAVLRWSGRGRTAADEAAAEAKAGAAAA